MKNMNEFDWLGVSVVVLVLGTIVGMILNDYQNREVINQCIMSGKSATIVNRELKECK